MSKGKTLIIAQFATLVLWWVLLTLIHSKQGYGNSLFGLCMGLYALVFGISISISAYRYNNHLPFRGPTAISSAGIAFFGLGTILWYHFEVFNNIVLPFPSASDIFYVLQFPLSSFGLILLSSQLSKDKTLQNDSKKKDNYLQIVLITLVYMIIIFLTVIFMAKYMFDGNLNLKNILEVYFPVESFSLTILSIFVLLKFSKVWQKTSFIWFSFVVLGFFSWFLADAFFTYAVQTSTFFSANYADLLYISGVFFMLLGHLGVLEGSKKEGFLSPVEPVFFAGYQSYTPVSLN